MLTAENGSSLTRRPSPGFSAKRRWCESLGRRPRGRAARPFEVRFVPIPSRLPDRQHALIDAGLLGLARRSTLAIAAAEPSDSRSRNISAAAEGPTLGRLWRCWARFLRVPTGFKGRQAKL